MSEPSTEEELTRLAEKAWPWCKPRVGLWATGPHVGTIEVMAPNGPGAPMHVCAVIDGGDKAHAALYATLLVLAGEEHPEVTALRAELAAANAALVTAQNELDDAGVALAKRSAERDRAVAEAERQRARAHDSSNRAQGYLAVAEMEAHELSKAGLHDAAQKFEADIAAVGKPPVSSVPPAAEDVATPRGFIS